MSTSTVSHNIVESIFIGLFDSGEGTEKENLAVEKEFETALAKGYRPCTPILELQGFEDL